jgi:hypothetical protein
MARKAHDVLLSRQHGLFGCNKDTQARDNFVDGIHTQCTCANRIAIAIA